MSYGAFIGEAEEMFGALGDSLEGMLPEMSSGVLADSVAAMFMIVSAMFASIPALQSILRLRSEEKAGRLDSLLSTPVARKRLLASYLVIALGSSVVFLFMAGIGMGITGSQSMGDISYLSSLTLAGLAFSPALWVAIGLAVFLYGLFPRKAGYSWAIVVYSFFVLYLGGALQLPEWLTYLSPFGHIPSMPAQDFELVPLLALTGVALVLMVIGFIGYRRRDITN
jgi:ABC-2 type transport system permease protein